MEYDIFTLQHDLSGVLTEKRLYHSIGVQAFCLALALHHGYNVEKANLAGLIHDCAKCIPDDQMLMECDNNNITVKEVERRNPYLLHGKLGAFYAEHKYGIKDSDILSSVVYHTTGKPDMTLLEKIVFTADYIEPNRSSKQIPDLNAIRALAFENLDEAVYKILENTLHYLEGVQKEIDNMTIDAYLYYKTHR